MKEYRIDMKVRNNLILKKMEDNGYLNVNAFCKANKVCVTSVGKIVNMKYKILKPDGEFSEYVERIASLLLCSPEDLFTPDQMHALLESNKKTILVNEGEMKYALSNMKENILLEDKVFEDQKQKAVIKSLEVLTPREQAVIKERFGLEGKEKTLKEVGKIFGITTERVRQIESKAMRKMRHPARSKEVREFL